MHQDPKTPDDKPDGKPGDRDVKLEGAMGAGGEGTDPTSTSPGDNPIASTAGEHRNDPNNRVQGLGGGYGGQGGGDSGSAMAGTAEGIAGGAKGNPDGAYQFGAEGAAEALKVAARDEERARQHASNPQQAGSESPAKE